MRSVTAMLLLVHSLGAAPSPDIISDVRAAIAQHDFALGERDIQAYRARQGLTPEMVEALSWLGRGALAAKSYDRADAYAADTRKLALELLKQRKLDAEPHLPLALGASIEVQAHVLAARSQTSEAIRFLRQELETYFNTSIRTRIQKNIHLLSLEGKPAPALESKQWLGPKPAPLDQLKGRPVLLFFWAHWCGDCKGEVPVLTRLAETYGPKGLILLGPTQHYGYTNRGQEATPEQETLYINEIRKQYYHSLRDMPIPISEENFRNYGASTTPTLVLLDRKGTVQLFHPGAMSYDDLVARVEAVMKTN